jgi:hypothetical protein
LNARKSNQTGETRDAEMSRFMKALVAAAAQIAQRLFAGLKYRFLRGRNFPSRATDEGG